jgi:hypothetical protein
MLQETCIILPSPVHTIIRKQCMLPAVLMLAALCYQKHNIFFQSSPFPVILQWNRLIVLEGPDLPSIPLTVSVTKEK